MEQYLKRALDGDNRIRPMDRQETQAIADAIIDAYMIELCGDVRDKGRLLRFFDRLRRVALMLMDSIQQELANSMFTVAAMEWDTHGYREGDPRPMTLRLEPDADPEEDALTDGCLPIPSEGKMSSPTDPQEEDSAVELLLGGRIDRVDIFRSADGETVYVRVVDYKSSRHDFTVKSITKDMNIQLLLYLFTLCSPRNRSLFAAADGHLPTRVVPASMVYISPDEADRKGALLPCRTGVTLDDPAVLRAVETVEDPETTMLPSMSRNKKGQLTGKGLYSAEQMAELETLLRSAILETASLMYRGCASRTPSPEACRYCPVRSSCGVNEES
jgi:RecB family exonuclease